jgi:septum formation topological specificity factor MinE
MSATQSKANNSTTVTAEQATFVASTKKRSNKKKKRSKKVKITPELQEQLDVFNAEYRNLISMFVENTDNPIGKPYYKELLKSTTKYGDVKTLMQIWDQNMSAIISGSPTFFSAKRVFFDFYSIDPYWDSFTPDIQDEIFLQIRKLYMIGKGCIQPEPSDDKQDHVIGLAKKMFPEFGEMITESENLADGKSTNPLQNFRKMFTNDLTPMIDKLYHLQSGYSKQGKSFTKEIYNGVMKHANEYCSFELSATMQNFIQRSLKRSITAILDMNTPVHIYDLIPLIMDQYSKIAREYDSNPALDEEIKKISDGVIADLRNNETMKDSPLIGVAEYFMKGTSPADDSDEARLEALLAEDDEKKEEKMDDLLERLKKGLYEGNLEEVALEWLHENPVVLSALRTKFPKMDFLKGRAKPKDKKERLKKILAMKRKQAMEKSGRR